MLSVEKLRDAVNNVPRRSKAATMRGLLPSIEQKISQGAQYKDIVAVLNKSGFEISINTFAVTLRRLRREEKEKQKTELHINHGEDDVEKTQLKENPAPSPGEADGQKDLGEILNSRDRDDYGDRYFKRKPIGNIGRNRSYEK